MSFDVPPRYAHGEWSHSCLVAQLSTFARAAPSAFVVSALLLTGCATQHAPVVVPQVVSTAAPSAADVLMQDIAQLMALSPVEQSAARETARDSFVRDPTDYRRLRLLVTLLVNPASPDDDERAISLAEPWVLERGAPLEQSVAKLVTQLAMERKRLRTEQSLNRARAVTASQQLRREERERDAESKQLRLRVEELEKQLIALKSIDRSVTRR
jgi:hypothetical protein